MNEELRLQEYDRLLDTYGLREQYTTAAEVFDDD
jgi:hypothetical protein